MTPEQSKPLWSETAQSNDISQQYETWLTEHNLTFSELTSQQHLRYQATFFSTRCDTFNLNDSEKEQLKKKAEYILVKIHAIGTALILKTIRDSK